MLWEEAMFFYTETVVNFPYFISSHKLDYGKLPIIEPSTVQPTPGRSKATSSSASPSPPSPRMRSVRARKTSVPSARKREVRHAGFPPPPRADRSGIQECPHAPPQAPAGEHRMEVSAGHSQKCRRWRQRSSPRGSPGRTVKRNRGPGKPGPQQAACLANDVSGSLKIKQESFPRFPYSLT